MELKELCQALVDENQFQIKSNISGWRRPNGDVDILEAWIRSSSSVRVKPEPLECWVNVYAHTITAYSHKETAADNANPTCLRVAVHMREVV